MTEVLYICGNDGSDTRVLKELRTLSKTFHVDYLGIGKGEGPKVENVKSFMVQGTHRNILSIIKLNYVLLRLLLANRNYRFAHVVDEQFLIFVLLPLKLFGHTIVLDIFDSMFLKMNKVNEQWLLLKKLLYGPVDRIIVTDDQRLGLLPRRYHAKTRVVPNYPERNKAILGEKPRLKGRIVLGYFGTLAKARGSEFIKKILDKSQDIEVISAGWISDEYTEKLITLESSRISFLGTLSQQNVNEILFTKVDYLVCIYPITNINNIYASPNKIYDAIQTKTQVIINADVKVSKFVEEKGLGVVVNDSIMDYDLILEQLRESRYQLAELKTEDYLWENYEQHFK